MTLLVSAPRAEAQIPESLKATCEVREAAPGHTYRFCDDFVPPVAGRTPNIGGVRAVRVPAKYDGWEGLPPKAADATTVPGSDPEGFVALDVDISIPTLPAPTGGYPVIAMMHGCCAGTKADWEAPNLDPSSERWHFNNAWFASRGYVVINYTARGFKSITRGSTGLTQLGSRRYEINDFQYLTGLVADDPFFNVNPQKVVATGGSYGGGFAWLALTDPLWTSPGGRDMRLAVAAPRYGWTDLAYSLIPNGSHFHSPDRLPAVDGSDTSTPFGIPKKTIDEILFLSGRFGTTFPIEIEQAFSCLQAGDPYESNPLCARLINELLPEFINDRSAYYQNEFFAKIATDPRYRVPVFNAATLTDPLFTPVENLRMSNRLQSVVPDYPIQQYFGDYQHFVQNKVREWADVCGADLHVCVLADYPGGDLNAAPNDLRRTGVTTRLNRFIDHFAGPPANPSAPQPSFDVTAALQICPPNASAEFPANMPGPTFTAPTFHDLAPNRIELAFSDTRGTTNPASPNPHALAADPLGNLISNGGRCPVHTEPAGPGVAVYESGVLTRPATMIGGTVLSIDYSATTAEGLQLNSRLYDVFPDGRAVMVDRGVRRVPSASGTVTYQLHGNAWRFEPGHRIRIEIAQDDDPYLKRSNIASSATLTGARLSIPVREAQPPARADFKNTSHYCKALRRFLGDDGFADLFASEKKGKGKGAGKGANSHGKCVSSKAAAAAAIPRL